MLSWVVLRDANELSRTVWTACWRRRMRRGRHIRPLTMGVERVDVKMTPISNLTNVALPTIVGWQVYSQRLLVHDHWAMVDQLVARACDDGHVSLLDPRCVPAWLCVRELTHWTRLWFARISNSLPVLNVVKTSNLLTLATHYFALQHNSPGITIHQRMESAIWRNCQFLLSSFFYKLVKADLSVAIIGKH